MSRADEMLQSLGFEKSINDGRSGAYYIKHLDNKGSNGFGEIRLTIRFSTRKRKCEYEKVDFTGKGVKRIPADITPDLALAICEKMKELGWIPETDQVSQIKESIVTIQKFKNQLQEIKKSLDDEIKAIKEKEAK